MIAYVIEETMTQNPEFWAAIKCEVENAQGFHKLAIHPDVEGEPEYKRIISKELREMGFELTDLILIDADKINDNAYTEKP